MSTWKREETYLLAEVLMLHGWGFILNSETQYKSPLHGAKLSVTIKAWKMLIISRNAAIYVKQC